MSFLTEKPRCLNDLEATLIATTDAENSPPTIVFEIKCRACGSGAFGFREVLHGKSPTGAVIHCRQCGNEMQVFDGLVHGYDGEFGHTDHLKGARSVTEMTWADGSVPTVAGLFAIFTYNGEADELEEISREENIRAVDLFDWFSLSTKSDQPDPTGRDYSTIWDYECA